MVARRNDVVCQKLPEQVQQVPRTEDAVTPQPRAVYVSEPNS